VLGIGMQLIVSTVKLGCFVAEQLNVRVFCLARVLI